MAAASLGPSGDGPPTAPSRPASPPGPSNPRPPAGGRRGGTTALRWTKDNSWSSGNVSFTLADRDRLTPGRVRYDRVPADGDEAGVTVSPAEFERTACQDG
ncbi:hypothetical protein [Streptomyces collinus]|uniref:hypothetical protein n=1 Tax=Streptomyces collinus TaxID=42684 RepID=UPI002941DCAA|nr:hypothetical protein [Streptomyces collinus]